MTPRPSAEKKNPELKEEWGEKGDTKGNTVDDRIHSCKSRSLVHVINLQNGARSEKTTCNLTKGKINTAWGNALRPSTGILE